jgi:hypothetical protein
LIAGHILGYLETEKQEFTDALTNPEGYEYLRETHIKRVIRFIDWMVEGLEGKKAEKPTRRKRKKKVKTPEQLTKSVKYLPSTKEYGGLESIPVTKIVGAQRLIIFNVKYRQFSIYEALSDRGFGIKGTTLQNFDPNKSKVKRIREKYLPELLKAAQTQGIRAINNQFNPINAKEETPTGRINKDCILLRVL